MGVYKQGEGKKGSLKWIQRLVNVYPRLLESRLRERFGIPTDVTFEWASPLESEGYAEYRDDGFLAAIGKAQLNGRLREFWPRGGP